MNISVVVSLFLIKFYTCYVYAALNENYHIFPSATRTCLKINVNDYEIHCGSSSTTITKSSCVGKRIDCSSDDNVSSTISQSTKSTCTIHCDSASSCDNSIITGLGCYNTIIIAPSTDASIANMTLYSINSKQITIKTSSSSFINSTIIIHPNTNKIEIDSKMFTNNNVITNFTHNYDDRYQKMSKYNLTTEKISTGKKTQTRLKTDSFLFQLFGNTMVFVNNTIDVNPKSLLVNIDDTLRNNIIFENNTFYLKSDAIFNESLGFESFGRNSVLCGGKWNRLCVVGKNYKSTTNCPKWCFESTVWNSSSTLKSKIKTSDAIGYPMRRHLSSEQSLSTGNAKSASTVSCDVATAYCYFNCTENQCSDITLNCPYDDTNPDLCQYCQLTCEKNGCNNIVFNSMNCKNVSVKITGENGLSNNSTIYGPGRKIDDNSYSYSAKSLIIQTNTSGVTYMSNTTVYGSKYGNGNLIKVICFESNCEYNTFYVYNATTLIANAHTGNEYHSSLKYNKFYIYDNSQFYLIMSDDRWYVDIRHNDIYIYDTALVTTNLAYKNESFSDFYYNNYYLENCQNNTVKFYANGISFDLKVYIIYNSIYVRNCRDVNIIIIADSYSAFRGNNITFYDSNRNINIKESFNDDTSRDNRYVIVGQNNSINISVDKSHHSTFIMSSNDVSNTLAYTCTSYCQYGSFSVTNGKLLYNVINDGQLQYHEFFMFDNSTFILDATQGYFINYVNVYGSSASYIEMDVGGSTTSTEIEYCIVYCPDNDLNDGVSCIIDYNDVAITYYNEYYAVDGIPTDLSLTLGQWFNTYTYETIQCGKNFNKTCKIYSNDDFNESSCDCFIPTSSPTESPTVEPSYPTESPTSYPSKTPTAAPTAAPLDAPTGSPSIPPTSTPTATPFRNPSNAPTISPSRSPSTAPTRLPSNSPSSLPTHSPSQPPTQTPSDSPTIFPTGSPTESPTKAPTNIYGSDNQKQLIYIYYTQTIDRALRLSLSTYAGELHDIVINATQKLMSDTSMNSICNKTDPNGIDCELSNYNPFHDADEEGRRRRRRMLNGGYSYNSNTSNGWWQGRIENLEFCVVLQNLMWDPSTCDDYYDESVYKDAEEFRSGKAKYIAFAPFDIVADKNVENFYNYFVTKFDDNGTAIANIINDLMKNYDSPKSKDIRWSTFKTVAVSITSGYVAYQVEQVDTFENTAFDIMYGLYAFMILCAVLALLAIIHARIIGADNVRVTGIVYFGVWTWDFASDVIFAARAAEQGFYYQCIASSIFVIIPWCLNMRQLIKHQDKWGNDPTIKDRVHSWLIDWSILLIVIAGASGSAFSAVEICNSQAFGLDFFTMGLTERHLKAFNGSRLYSTIAWENLPQLAIQIWYTFDRSGVDDVAIFAFLSSTISVFIALIDVYSSQALIRAMKSAEKANRMFKGQPYFLEILGNYDGIADDDNIMKSEIEEKKKLLMMKPNAIRRVFGEVLEIDYRAIELTLCVGVHNGIQFGFTLYTADKISRKERFFTILDSIVSKECDFIQGVMNVWNLNDRPVITNIETLYNSYEQYEVEEYERDRLAIEESEVFLQNPNMFEFNPVGHYNIITMTTHDDILGAIPIQNSRAGFAINDVATRSPQSRARRTLTGNSLLSKKSRRDHETLENSDSESQGDDKQPRYEGVYGIIATNVNMQSNDGVSGVGGSVGSIVSPRSSMSCKYSRTGDRQRHSLALHAAVVDSTRSHVSQFKHGIKIPFSPTIQINVPRRINMVRLSRTEREKESGFESSKSKGKINESIELGSQNILGDYPILGSNLSPIAIVPITRSNSHSRNDNDNSTVL